MKSKSSLKKPAPAKKSANKNKEKPVKPQNSPLLAHWLHDISLESAGPNRAFAPGERQLELLVRAQHGTISQEGHVRLELRLRAHIHIQNATLAVAEIKYAGVVEKLHSESEVPALLAEIYPFARQALEATLAMVGHQAPLPEALDVSKI